MDYQLNNVNQVRENLIGMTQLMLRSWVREQRKPFCVSDIYADPKISSDLYINIEMIRAIKEALARMGCEPVASDGQLKFAPPVRLIDRDLLVS